MASTKEFSPGFKCNMVYDYIRWIDQRLIKLLNLHEYGLELFSSDPIHIALDEKGKHIVFYADPQQTAKSIAHHSSEDADNWLNFTKYITKLTQCLDPIYRMTPPNISELGLTNLPAMSMLLKPILKHGRRGLVDMIRTVPMMMPELLDEWFESDLLRGSLAACGTTHLTQGPYSAATGLNFLHQHMYSNGIMHNCHFIKGGTGHFAQILSQIAQDKGVEIMTKSMVTSINCKQSICSGVTTSNGQTFNANIVISGLDPANTGIKLVGTHQINPILQKQLNNIKFRGSTARVHFALNKYPKVNGVSPSHMQSVFTTIPTMEYLEHAYDDAKYGRVSENLCVEFTIPSIINANFSPTGKHVLSSTIQYVPYYLQNANWNQELKDSIIENVTQILSKYIPCFADIIEESVIITPVDLEASLGHTEGNINHGEMTLDQFFFLRPTISTAQYRTSIKNLYHCGPGTHPGGGLHGCNAANAVSEIIKDLRT